MKIGPYHIPGRAWLAPMAGVTDLPFRRLCHEFGAAVTPSEMLTSDTRLYHTRKSQLRRVHEAEPAPRVVQLAGADPAQVATAARLNVDEGAQIIDINMGCPAKKVCDRLCGSALLGDAALVARILEATVRAVNVPVTVKIRTGLTPATRNAVQIAQLAERCGIAAIAVHGRTRAQRFEGEAEFATIADVVRAVRIPVIANGDIRDAQRAREVLAQTGAAAIMIGRGAQGSPWIFRDVNAFLLQGEIAAPLLRVQMTEIILRHLESLYEFYGETAGVRIARKHLGWYCQLQSHASDLRPMLMAAESSVSQMEVARREFGRWAHEGARAA